MDPTRLALCPEDCRVAEPRAAARAEVHHPLILHAARRAAHGAGSNAPSREGIVRERHEGSEVTARTRDARATSDSSAAPTPPLGRGWRIGDSCIARFPG